MSIGANGGAGFTLTTAHRIGCNRTMVPTIKRLTLSLGFTVCLGFAFVPQGCGGVQHPVADIPEHVAAPIKGCAFEHTHHVRDADHIVKYDVTLDSNGQVETITLVDSTIGDEELEQCIAASIRSLTQYDLLRPRSENFDRELAQPESRMLLGNPAVPLAVCVASPPCLLALGMVVAGSVYTVQIIVHAATTAKPTAITTGWPMATAKPTATTTAPPIPIALPRKYPNQTCEEVERIRLEADKDKVCPEHPLTFPGKSCSDKGKNARFLPEYPCSLIKARIPAMLACIAARQKVQDECFKNSPDSGHPQQIDDLTKGVKLCEALKVVNCAPGHPMSGL
ncbi:MAG: hypothetical protein IPM54_45445 [Polyangiaceae bacterium]|nr:hypothetical protein [Polyangiaceae bacterium]